MCSYSTQSPDIGQSRRLCHSPISCHFLHYVLKVLDIKATREYKRAHSCCIFGLEELQIDMVPGKSFSPLILFVVSTICFFSALPDGNAVPVLRDSSKTKSPPKTSYNSQVPSQIPVLGKAGNIRAIKQGTGPARFRSPFKLKQVSARSVLVMDAHTGKTLFSRAPDTPRQPASTIKVLTGIIAIDMLTNKERVAVSRRAAKQPRSKVYLDQRQTYLANDLINAVLLASANDASVALAEKIAGTEQSFARLMTAKAGALGAQDTVCKTASGLTAKGQKTTARDLATIFRAAMRNKEFAARMKKTKAVTSEGKVLRNHNKALWQIDGALAGKTGYTNAARQTYVGAFRRGSDEIIVALLGSETMWTDIKKLVSYGFTAKRRTASRLLRSPNKKS